MVRRIERLVTAALLASVGASALASHANAISFVSASEETTPGFGVAPIAECPAGKHVLGGGVYSSAGFDSSDTEALQGWIVGGASFRNAWRAVVDGFTTTTVTSYAVCRTGSVAYRAKSFDVDAGERSTETVRCPRGYRVTGGGLASPAFDEVKSSRPVKDGTAWEGSLLNIDDYGESWGLRAYCVDGAFAKHLVYKDSADKVKAGEQDGDVTDCPGHDGLVGGGTYVAPGGSNLNSTAPVDDEAWRSYVDHTGVGPSLQYKTYAICHQQRASTVP